MTINKQEVIEEIEKMNNTYRNQLKKLTKTQNEKQKPSKLSKG